MIDSGAMRPTGGRRWAGIVRWLPAGLLAVVCGLQVYWVGIKRYDYVGENLTKVDQFQGLRPRRAIGQIFSAQRDHLARFRVLLSLPKDSTGSSITVQLQEVGAGANRFVLEERRVEEGGWLDVRFEPIPDSKGRTFHFFMVTEGDHSDPVAVGLLRDNPYHEGSAYGEGLPKGWDLCFGFFYSETVYERLDLLTEGKPFPFGSRAFLIAGFLFYNLLLALFILRVFPLVVSFKHTVTKE